MKPLENKGYLNLKEFQVSCHLLEISKKIKLPNKLPKCLIDYLGRNNNIQEKNIVIQNKNISESEIKELLKN